MTEEEMIARGKLLFEQCYGGIVPVPETNDGRTYPGMSLKMFNDVWGDGALSFREKRLIGRAGRAGRRCIAV